MPRVKVGHQVFCLPDAIEAHWLWKDTNVRETDQAWKGPSSAVPGGW